MLNLRQVKLPICSSVSLSINWLFVKCLAHSKHIIILTTAIYDICLKLRNQTQGDLVNAIQQIGDITRTRLPVFRCLAELSLHISGGVRKEN